MTDIPPNQQQQPPQLGWRQRISQNIDMARKGYEQLVHAIIRPPRAQYKREHLGPSDFTFLGTRFIREDLELNTGRNNLNWVPPETEDSDDEDAPPPVPPQLKLHASLWTRKEEEEEDANKKRTMVVYLHGNASARVEVLPSLSFLLASGVFGVCSLDFCGSGHSDGDYVSLGYYERFDLECLLQYLQTRYSDLEIVLWGRSMGASTALMHASQKTRDSIQFQRQNSGDLISLQPDPDSTNAVLKGLICDSPFASLPQLCQELVEKAREQGVVVPGVIVSVALAMIARSVRNMAHFNINDICPIQHSSTIATPALFVVGADDDFIPPHHAEDICATYQRGISTNLLMVPGGHNDARPILVYEAVGQFLSYRLTCVGDTALTVPDYMRSRLHQNPPWAYQSQPHIFTAHAGASENATTIVASSAASNLGMTQERQDDIQNKLHQMLGQQQQQQSATATNGGTTTSTTGDSERVPAAATLSSSSLSSSTSTTVPPQPQRVDPVALAAAGIPEGVSVGVPINLADLP